jgi:hypothetical protein
MAKILSGFDIYLAGANNALLFQRILSDEYGGKIREIASWNILQLPGNYDKEKFSITEKNILLAKLKVLRLVDDLVIKKSLEKETIAFGIHSSAVFKGEEQMRPDSKEDVKKIILDMNGHSFDYYFHISAKRINLNGEMLKSSNKTVKVCLTMNNMNETEISEYVEKIPQKSVSEYTPIYRPLVSPGFRLVLEEVPVEIKIFESDMRIKLDEICKELIPQ